jgi:hypothetical protein
MRSRCLHCQSKTIGQLARQVGAFRVQICFCYRMAIPRRLTKGDVRRRTKKDGHDAATAMRSGAPQRGNLKINASALTPPSANHRYLTRLGDAIMVGPLQLACHVSRYAEPTFSKFCQEYLLDTARTI